MSVWKPEQIAQAMELRFKHQKRLREIGEVTGHTAQQVANLLRRVIDTEVDRKSPATREMMRSFGGHTPPPIEVLFDRNRRLNAEKTPNMIVLGDPVTPRWNSNASR